MNRDIINKVPPHSKEAEQALLGSILVSPGAIDTALEYVKPEDFYFDAHKKIFEAMIGLYEKNTPIDLITVTEELKKRNLLDEVGGAVYLSQLPDFAVSPANIDYYAKMVRDHAVLRELLTAAYRISEMVYSSGEEVEDILDRAQMMILEISSKRGERGVFPIKDVIQNVLESIDALIAKREEGVHSVIGIPTGFSRLDNLIYGLQKGQLIIVAARPSMGKTAFCLNIAAHVAGQYKVPVLIFSLEMPAEHIAMRMLASEGLISLSRLINADLSQEDWHKIIDVTAHLTEAPIFIDHSSGLTVLELRSKARRMKQKHNIGLVIVDFLQLVQAKTRRTETRQQEVSEVSRSLKLLATELQIPVIAVSQLSRYIERRERRRPMLSDLRESGAIEQDADVVIFLHREDIDADELEEVDEPEVEVIVGKNRNGPIGSLYLRFHKAYTKFVEIETRYPESYFQE